MYCTVLTKFDKCHDLFFICLTVDCCLATFCKNHPPLLLLQRHHAVLEFPPLASRFSLKPLAILSFMVLKRVFIIIYKEKIMKLNKWIVGGLMALILSACGGTQESAEATKSVAQPTSKVLRVGTNAEFAPFEYTGNDGKIIGFDIDIMSALAKAGGFEVEFKHQPWDGIFASLSTGDNDVLVSAITITEERKQSMSFSDPYFEIKQVVLVPEGKNISSVEELKNVGKVGVVTGQTGDLAMQKLLGATNERIARFESLPLVLKEIENGGLDAVVSDSAVIRNYVKNNGDKGFSIINIDDFDQELYGMALRKDDDETLQMINDALKTIRENGEYDKIYEQYFAK